MQILNQEWIDDSQKQLEAFDVPTLVSILYKTVESELHSLGTLRLGQYKFADGRVEWDATMSNSKSYSARWCSTQKEAIINLILHYQISQL